MQEPWSALGEAVERAPLGGGDAKSGSRLERVVLADGTALIVKTVSPEWDWIMRATHDEGRAGLLWASSVLARVAPTIEHAILGAERDGDAWTVVMRDVSAALIPPNTTVTRARSRHILEALNRMHETFRGERIEGLCSLEDRYRFLSPSTAAVERAGLNPLPKLIGHGWDVFGEMVPSDIAAAVFAILADPSRIADELRRVEMTLVHGDLKIGNVGFDGDRVVVIDWGSLTGIAPPAVEFAWYIAINASRIAASHDELYEDVREAGSLRSDRRTTSIAFLGALVQLGWNKALDAAQNADAAVRAREAEDLAWWVRRAREALEIWSPV